VKSSFTLDPMWTTVGTKSMSSQEH